MTCLGDEMRALQLCALRMHRLEGPGVLIDGPFIGAADVTGRNINLFSRKAVELIPKWLVIVDSIVVEPTLESGPAELCCIDLQIGFSHPLARGYILWRRLMFSHRLRHSLIQIHD